MSRAPKPAAYRRRIIRGKPIAYLQIRDPVTGRRRDYWLGSYGSPESREAYARVIAEWESHHRRLPPGTPFADAEFTIDEMIDRHWDAVGTGYGISEQYSIRSAADVLSELHGHTPAAAFGPLALRAVQAAMVTGQPGDPAANPPIAVRKPWRRKVVNTQLARVRAIFRWAESYELVPAGTCHALSTVPALRAGRTTAPESKPVRPVPESDVLAVLPLLSDQVADMVRLMLLTGMRPGEVCCMTRAALDATDPAVWVYRPAHHKTAHHGHTRRVLIGRKAQAIIEKYMPGRAPDVPFFSPAEAEAVRRKLAHENRKTPLSCGNRPGTNRVLRPKRNPGAEYDASAIGRAIRRAIDQYNAKAKAERRPVIGYWHPHQLRHTYATQVRRQFGLEAAQIMLGHSSAIVTDAVYAERDERASRRIAEKIG